MIVGFGEGRGGAEGTLTSQQRYLPFGGVRTLTTPPNSPITSTDLGYTGQRDLGMGLMDYKARFYSPTLGRFTQPDSIIPNPGNPQDFNRFSYTANNPINYNDPTGHNWEDCKEGMSDYLCKQHKKKVDVINGQTDPPTPPTGPGCDTLACISGTTGWHNILTGGSMEPGNSSLSGSGYGGTNANAIWNPLSLFNWGGSTNPIALYQSPYNPGFSLKISAQYSSTIANGSPVTIAISPSGIVARENFLRANNGFSLTSTSNSTFGYTQSLWGEALNGFNSSSGFDFNPVAGRISSRASVMNNSLTVTQTLTVEYTIDSVVTAAEAILVGVAFAIWNPWASASSAPVIYKVLEAVH